MRLTVTRGHASRDPLHGESFRPTCFMTAEELLPYAPEFYERGLTVVVNSEQKLNPYDIQAGHKTLDYFSRFAALREATRRVGGPAGESLWFNVHNFLQSGSISNVFIVEEIDGAPALVTPPTNEDLQEEAVKRSCPYPRSNVLPGVTRAAVIDWARAEGMAVHRLPIDVNRLLAAREVFLTNSIMGVMPVTRVEQRIVGEASPGEVTRRVRSGL
jgi:branched-subunit amino acid aminotransferase/4-amino-4-deoxychorismate lyase